MQLGKREELVLQLEELLVGQRFGWDALHRENFPITLALRFVDQRIFKLSEDLVDVRWILLLDNVKVLEDFSQILLACQRLSEIDSV